MIDYKKILRNRETRMAILRMLSFIPDKPMIYFQYWIKTGHKLNLKNPQRYTEKMQWLKLYYRDPKIVQCTDKYEVRSYVKSKGLEKILNECYGVFNNAEDIDFDVLPEQFVLKDTLGSAGNQVIVIKNKKNIDYSIIKRTLKKWVNTPIEVRDDGREWAYQVGKPHRIIIEKYLDASEDAGGLIDYKFHCYKGIPKFLYVIADRKLGNGAGLGIYDIDYNRLPYRRVDEKKLEREISMPQNYQEMLEIASKLSAPFIYTRIDLYNQNGNIIFGEISFFDGSGYMTFDPDEFDYILGKDIDLSNIQTLRRK